MQRPAQFEAAGWRLVHERPPRHHAAGRWPTGALSCWRVSTPPSTTLRQGVRQLARCTYGARKPVARASPAVARRAAARRGCSTCPRCELPGDHHMPRVQDGAFGASERFAVSPGREAEGYLELPGGPSGHPLSPFYRSGFDDWAAGRPTPFLPGPAAHKLMLRPQRRADRPSDHMSEARFTGTDRYVATPDLMMAVNAAVTLARPLLIKGEPGTGKTQLAEEIARSLRAPAVRVAHQVHQQGAARPVRIRRGLAPARLAARRSARCTTSATTSSRAACGRRSSREVQPVLLIDEIDKADIEFPNDLLRELDRMEFYVHETRELIRARHRPIILITSNNEKELPDAFLRRCFFHYIRFPDAETMEKIVRVHFPDLKKELLRRGADRVLRRARDARASRRSRRPPSCSTGSSYCWPRTFRPRRCAATIRRRPSRSCTARCSRTNRTCTCSSSWCS